MTRSLVEASEKLTLRQDLKFLSLIKISDLPEE